MNPKFIFALGLILSVNSFAASDIGVGFWTVSEGNITCLIVTMDIKVNFTYKTLDNATKIASYQVPWNATVDRKDSQCALKQNTLTASWESGNFSMQFASSNSSKYDLTYFVVNLSAPSLFNDSAINQTVTIAYSLASESFDVPSNFSYHCTHVQKLNGTDEQSFFLISKVQFEAFRHDNTHKFSVAKDCDSTIPADIVPIAVGISLIALIVVVLIAYIVGRRRQQARGYLNIM